MNMIEKFQTFQSNVKQPKLPELAAAPHLAPLLKLGRCGDCAAGTVCFRKLHMMCIAMFSRKPQFRNCPFQTMHVELPLLIDAARALLASRQDVFTHLSIRMVGADPSLDRSCNTGTRACCMLSDARMSFGT